jgi:hypothetical protein
MAALRLTINMALTSTAVASAMIGLIRTGKNDTAYEKSPTMTKKQLATIRGRQLGIYPTNEALPFSCDHRLLNGKSAIVQLQIPYQGPDFTIYEFTCKICRSNFDEEEARRV